MATDITPDPELIRKRTVHGYQAFETTSKGQRRVTQYLQDGDPRPLEGTRYAEERLKVVGRLTAAERADLGMKPKGREPKPKLTPPPGSPQTMGEAAEHVANALHKSDMKLIVAVTEDGVALMDVNCPPEEALQLLHALMHSLQDKMDRPDPTMN